MKDVKDILKLLSTTIAKEGLSTIASASKLDEVELTEDQAKEIKEGISSLMTFDAALNNPKINEEILQQGKPKIQSETLYRIEKRLKGIAEKVDIDLKGKEKAHEMLDIIEEDIHDSVNKDGNEKQKALIESYKKDNLGLTNQIKEQKEEFEQKFEIQKGENEDNLLERDFYLYANKYTWAKAYNEDKTKNSLIKGIKGDINSLAKLKLISGEIVPFQKDFPEKEYMEENTIVSFKDLFEPRVEKYLMKSETPPKPPKPGGNGEDKEFSDMTQAQQTKLRMENSHG